MQAKDLYAVGCKAYEGHEEARVAWFEMLKPIAMYFGRLYDVLPSLIMAKAATESGWATDLYEEVLEERFGVEMQQKAQKHNNIFALNDFEENEKYLETFPLPNWMTYRESFADYGTHYDANGNLTVKIEPWKRFRSLEDCIEDWCANMRYRAYKDGKGWGLDIRTELRGIEGYTPEGAKAEREGMRYEWQDNILSMYDKYNLAQYDYALQGRSAVEMITANLDWHIKKAYEYAHSYCHYAATDRSFPPMEDGKADCVGLVLRALYTMGILHKACNIDEIHELCTAAGMAKTTNVVDVERTHSVVCFQDNNNIGTNHVNHVFYSLGGDNGRIDKYDLGSEERIRSVQPFCNVPVDEWSSKTFLCAYYCPDQKEKPFNLFTGEKIFDATIKKETTMRELAGKDNKPLEKLEAGESVEVYAACSTTRLNRWLYVKHNGRYGWVYNGATKHAKFTVPKDKHSVHTPDNCLYCRTGAGVEYPLFKPISMLQNEETVRIVSRLTAKDGSKWLNVYKGGYLFFVGALWVL